MSYPLSFLPLGGVGRIGMNNLVMRWGDHRWLIDCGVMFPDERSRFADKVLPDLDWIRARAGSFRGIVLTHAHEDHVGAVPFVLEVCPMPVYGSRFTLGLVRHKLAERGIEGADLRLLEPDMGAVACPEVDGIAFRMIRVTHSIPDAASLAITTPLGTILHTGDFKIDEEPLDGQAFDREAFRALGDEGVLLMLSDSTNVQVPGRNRSEASVIAALEERIAAWPGRVLVAQFSSNLHRLRGLAGIAEHTGRRLCLLGRSLHTYSQIARVAGLPTVDLSKVIAPESLEGRDGAGMLVVLTGSQAERRASLSRAARGEHSDLTIRDGDLILLSARMIPGNEGAIHSMINELSRRGARVIHPGAAPGIHTSGHARRDELRELIDLVRPRCFVPVHGEYSFLIDHEALAREAGISETLLIVNGEEIALDQDGLHRVAEHTLRAHYHDGSVVAGEEELRHDDRRRLFYNGVVAAHIAVSSGGASLDCDVELQSRGVYTRPGLLDSCADALVDALRELPSTSDAAAIEEASRIHVRRFFRRIAGKKPEVVTFVSANSGGAP